MGQYIKTSIHRFDIYIWYCIYSYRIDVRRDETTLELTTPETEQGKLFIFETGLNSEHW